MRIRPVGATGIRKRSLPEETIGRISKVKLEAASPTTRLANSMAAAASVGGAGAGGG